jgi:thiol-disulfide isomerase/thioredoxin
MVFGSKKVIKEMQPALKAAGETLQADGPNMLILTMNTQDSSLDAVLDRFEVKPKTKGPVYRVADSSGEGGLQALRPAATDKKPAWEPTAEGIVEHCKSLSAGGFKRLLRSADSAPEPMLGKKARELIGKTFIREVEKDKKHDSVVFFYMSGCGHCKALKKPFKKIIKKFPNIRFFTMDGTRNEVESSITSGYPTVYFYPKDDKTNPIVISARDKKGLKEFLTTHQSTDDDESEEKADVEVKDEL